ncbi:MAG: tetratricopeptide repeat protein [Acidobacteria bacterium]|nr:tetratricopeptide repeat protein [Acidobacteriota bacterium]
MSTPAINWAWFVDEELVQSSLALESGDLQWNKRIASHPAIADALHFHLQGDCEGALAALRPAIVAGNPDALLLAGQLSFESGKTEDAARHYKRLAELKPDHLFASLNAGICLARLRRWRMAVECLQRAVVLDPDCAQSWYVLGVCLLNERRAAEARSSFAHSLKVRSDYAPAWFGQAAALQLEGKHQEALDIYERLLSAQPDHVAQKQRELLENALYAAWQLNDRTRIKAYSVLLARNSMSTHGLWAQLVLAVDARDFAAAADLGSALAQGESSTPVDWYNYGVCLRLAGRHQEAAGAFENVVAANPDDAGAACELAAAHWACGNVHQAEEAYEEALFRDPSREQARLSLLLLALERGDAARAEDLRSGIHDAHGAISFRIGVLRHRSGQLEEAVNLYLDSLSRNPEQAECRWNLAHALHCLKRFPEAKLHWRKALELDPSLGVLTFKS